MSYVYLISDGEFYKIGKTDLSPLKRLRQLQTGNRRPLRLIHLFECSESKLLEKRLHYLLRRFRVRGEWYNFDADMVNWLCSKDAHSFGAFYQPLSVD